MDFAVLIFVKISLFWLVFILKGGHALAQLVEALRNKPESCGFDS